MWVEGHQSLQTHGMQEFYLWKFQNVAKDVVSLSVHEVCFCFCHLASGDVETPTLYLLLSVVVAESSTRHLGRAGVRCHVTYQVVKL